MPVMAPSYRVQPHRREAMDPATRRLAIFAGSIGAALLLLVGAWSFTGHRHGAVPVIEADSRPMRVKPANPGGLQVDGANDGILSGEADGKEAVAPPPESPQPQALKAQEDAAAQSATGQATADATGQGAGAAHDQRPLPALRQHVAAATPKSATLATTAARPSVALAQTSSHVGAPTPLGFAPVRLIPGRAPAGSVGTAASRSTTTQVAQSDTPEGATTPQAPVAPVTAAPLPAPAGATSAPAAPATPAPASLAPAAPAAAAPPAPRPATVAPPPAVARAPAPGTGKTLVQLGALTSGEGALQEWERLSKRFPDLLGNRHPNVTKTEHGGKTYWRLRTGGFSDSAQAAAFCERLRAKGAACTVASF
jgi:hypothetical protein